MAILNAIVAAALVLSLLMMAAWGIAVRSGKSGWIDAIWSFSVGLVGVAAALVHLNGVVAWESRQYLVAGLVAAWSVRLGLHIAGRTLKGGDDPRYAELKSEWGESFQGRLFWFLQLQAAAAFVLVVTIAVAAHNPAPGIDWKDGLGALILAIAIVGEGIADRQLAAFASDRRNEGRVCDVGLWSLTRHPNYFFEWLGWVAYAVIAANFAGTYPWGWIAIAGPVFMYWLLVHVSGIPPLEKHMHKTRGDAFRDYQTRVNAFWPGPSRTRPSETSNERERAV